jgi:hypothetical protein
MLGNEILLSQLSRIQIERTSRFNEASFDKHRFQVHAAAPISEIDVSKLTYFGASILWRASSHRWRSLKDEVPQLYLGKYTEELRSYLLGETPFPANIVILIGVIPDERLWLVACPHMEIESMNFGNTDSPSSAFSSQFCLVLGLIQMSALYVLFAQKKNSSLQAIRLRTCLREIFRQSF